MTVRPRAPGGLATPLLHWLVLLVGLALLVMGDLIEAHQVTPTCLGAIAGTAMGQAFAELRLRAWAAFFAAIILVTIGSMLLWNGFPGSGSALEAFVPATACGYFSLTARGTLAAFWFPAVPWTLAILDAERSDAATIAPTWLLWTGLGALLVAALWARETRRVAQWKTHALADLAGAPRRIVSHQAPLGPESRALWPIALIGTTAVLAAWISPLLRQWDAAGHVAVRPAAGPHVEPASVAERDAPGHWLTCCPEEVGETPTRRIREYIAPRHREATAPRVAIPGCVACSGGVPLGRTSTAQPAVAANDDGVDVHATTLPDGAGGAGAHGGVHHTTEAAPTIVDGVAYEPPTPAPVVAKPLQASPPRAVGPSGVLAPTSDGVVAPSARDAVLASADDASGEHAILRSLVAIVLAGCAASLVLRPLRRWFVLRHLRRPWWEESVSQRVSNFWQLALIGLRDAGWHVGPNELPQHLARRVGVEGMKICADVLDRARHGVRVDADDLAAMERAAAAVFAGARGQAGVIARVASWWRTPAG